MLSEFLLQLIAIVLQICYHMNRTMLLTFASDYLQRYPINIVKTQNKLSVASGLNLPWYEMEYERKFYYGMKYGMEDFYYGMKMEWKKIASKEYGKIVFHSIPYHALSTTMQYARSDYAAFY